MDKSLVVLPWWKFLIVFFISMSISVGFAVVIMTKLLLKQNAQLFPVAVSAAFWSILLSTFAGGVIFVLAVVAREIWALLSNSRNKYGSGED